MIRLELQPITYHDATSPQIFDKHPSMKRSPYNCYDYEGSGLMQIFEAGRFSVVAKPVSNPPGPDPLSPQGRTPAASLVIAHVEPDSGFLCRF